MWHGCSILGGVVGLLIGRQGDILFGVDTQIVGLVLGVSVGNILVMAFRSSKRTSSLTNALGAAGSVISILAIEPGPGHVLAEVALIMAVAAALCTWVGTVLIMLLKARSNGNESSLPA